MLRKLSVKNFRLLRDVTIDVEPGKPIVLIGPNGSGKSSVIQVLDLLSRWGDEGFQQGCSAFGKFLTAGQKQTTIEIETDVLAHWLERPDGMQLLYRVEVATIHDVNATEYLAKRSDSASSFNPVLNRSGSKLTFTNETTLSEEVFDIPENLLSFERVKQAKVFPSLSELNRAIQNIVVYDGFLTTPSWTRDLREAKLSPFNSVTIETIERIGRRGLDLTNALYYIQQNFGEIWDDLMDHFRAEFPFVQRLEFPADRVGGSISLAFRDKRYPGERLQSHQMSEGMATYLCLLAAILSPSPATAIAFDEPDRHLHPSALRRIAFLLERASEKTAVFVATHSDRFLDYLSDPGGSIRICEPTSEGVKLRMLNGEALDEWRKLYSMSTLRERGQLDPSNNEDYEP